MSTPPTGRSPSRRRDGARDRLDVPEKKLVDTSSDLRARVLVAIPAVAVALFLVISGGPIFAAGMVVLGVICLHELFLMFAAAHPSRLGALIALLGLIAAAHFGDRDERPDGDGRELPGHLHPHPASAARAGRRGSR